LGTVCFDGKLEVTNSGKTAAHEFFEIHAKPNFEEWEKSSLDIRLAMNAVVSLFHMADYFWNAHKGGSSALVFNAKTLPKFRTELASRNPDFQVLDGIANSHKHMKLTWVNHFITNASQTSIGTTGFGVANWGSGSYGGDIAITVLLNNNSTRDVSDILRQVISMWDTMLYPLP
jgi:hypothetical protein